MLVRVRVRVLVRVRVRVLVRVRVPLVDIESSVRLPARSAPTLTLTL